MPNTQEAMELPRLDGAVTTGCEVAEKLETHGAVVVEHAVSEHLMDQLGQDLAACTGKFQGKAGSFAGASTTRNAGKPLGESCIAQQLATHPLVLDAVRARLHPWCKRFVLGTCSAIDVEPPPPNEEPPPLQALHRDESMWPVSDFDFSSATNSRPEFCVSVMWAASDFTKANGATRLIPGSHRWERPGQESYDEDDDITQQSQQSQQSQPQKQDDSNKNNATQNQEEQQQLEDFCVPGTMPRGSVLLWSGATIHGQGGHAPWTSSDASTMSTRRGLLFIYNLGWLRPEHNLHWALPREIMRGMPESLRELLGLVGTNPVDHEWYTGPVYAQPLLGMARNHEGNETTINIGDVEGGGDDKNDSATSRFAETDTKARD